MRFDPNMFLRGYNPTPIEPESNALLRGIQMQGARQGNALNALKLQAAQQQMAEQAQQRNALEAFKGSIVSPQMQASQQALQGGGGPTVANAARMPAVDPRTQMLYGAMQAGQIAPMDYLNAAMPAPVKPERKVVGNSYIESGPGGVKVLYESNKAPTLPASAQEFEYAKANGFKGTFEQWKRGPKAAGGTGPAPAAAPGAMIPPADDRRTLAGSLGVPVAERDPFAGMSEKSAEIFKRSLYKDAEKRLTDVAEAAASAQSMARDVKQFLELQQGVSMQGPIAGRVPAFTSDAQTMDAITARITPQMRQPGSGATSDFDAKMFQMATVSRSKNDEANAAIGNAVVLQAENAVAREQFMRDYLSVNGHLDGADRQWKRYIDANPIFDPKSGNVPKLNPARVPYQQFFGSGAAPAQPNPGKPAAPAAGAAVRTATNPKTGEKLQLVNGQWVPLK